MIKSNRCLVTAIFIGTGLTDSYSSTSPDLTVNTNVESASGFWQEYPVPTKKERIQKIALAKMYVSWNNKKRHSTLKTKQNSRPRHAINYFGGKKFKNR